MFTSLFASVIIGGIIYILIVIFILIFFIYLLKEILKRNDNTMQMIEIANYFEISEREINKIFEKLRWLEKKEKYWKVTEKGKQKGGIEAFNFKQGISEPLWNIKIVHEKALINIIKIYKETPIIKI